MDDKESGPSLPRRALPASAAALPLVAVLSRQDDAAEFGEQPWDMLEKTSGRLA